MNIPNNEPLRSFRLSDNLPDLLKKGVDQFKEDHEKYLFLYSAITAISGLLTKVSGIYRESKMYPNLFLLVIAPPAAGKSIMMYSKRLIRGIQDQKRKEADEQLNKFLVKEREARKAKSAFLPQRPPYSIPLIPGNVTGSKLITHLADNEANDCPSILIESEIDTLVGANKKNEHGNFSDTLRKAWENEDVSMSRRGNNNEYHEAKSPKLAVALSGTPNQVRGLIGNSGDGLFSRFAIYTIDGVDGWSDVSPCDGCNNLTDFFDKQAGDYRQFYEYHSQNPLEIKLTKEQWDKLNKFGQEKLDEINEYENQNAASLIKRHAGMIFKIALVLTAYRQFEDAIIQEERICEDRDFETALSLVEMSLVNSVKIFQQLPGGQLNKMEDRSDELYALLPDNFTRKEALVFRKNLNVSEKTIERNLKTLIKKGKLKRTGQGKYQKISVTE